VVYALSLIDDIVGGLGGIEWVFNPDAISPSWLWVVGWWTSWCLSEWVGELD